MAKWQLFCVIATLVSSVMSGYVQEEDLIERRAVMDRKRPYKKLEKYIECQVCEFAAQSIFRIWLMSMNDNKFDEDEMYNLIVETCNPWSNIGVWITAMDMFINDENGLELVNKEEIGQCNRKCETVKSVCEDIVSSDAETIAEYIWTNKNDIDNPKLTQYICSNVCDVNNRMPKVPKKLAKKYNIADEEWVEMTQEEQQKRIDIFHEIMDENKIKQDL